MTATDLVQFGVLGVMLGLVALGVFWPKPSVDDLLKRLERTEGQRDALIETYQAEIIPALRDANRGTTKAVTALEDVSPLLAEVKVLLLREGST